MLSLTLFILTSSDGNAMHLCCRKKKEVRVIAGNRTSSPSQDMIGIAPPMKLFSLSVFQPGYPLLSPDCGSESKRFSDLTNPTNLSSSRDSPEPPPNAGIDYLKINESPNATSCQNKDPEHERIKFTGFSDWIGWDDSESPPMDRLYGRSASSPSESDSSSTSSNGYKIKFKRIRKKNRTVSTVQEFQEFENGSCTSALREARADGSPAPSNQSSVDFF